MKLLRLLAPWLCVATAFAAPAADDPAALAAAGNAAYRKGDTASAVLNWERAILLDSRQPAARAGLAVATHDGAQAPRPAATEYYAGLLPANAWILLLAGAGWTAVVVLSLPYVSPLKRRDWHHPLAGVAATVALLAIPGIIGSDNLRRRAVILKPDTTLRLTPTSTGESLGTLSPGDRVRLVGRHGDRFFKVRGPDGTDGWVESSRVAPVVPEENS